MDPRKCKTCGTKYTPRPMGYNSLYCSKACRNKFANRNQVYSPSERKRSYQRTKENPEAYALHLRSGATGRKLIREWLSHYKIERGCVDCGYKEYACALQLDHEGDKSIAIADARSSINRLKREIEKGRCVVRCANCHSIRTWRTKQHDRSQESTVQRNQTAA
jgi:hypothetical protein